MQKYGIAGCHTVSKLKLSVETNLFIFWTRVGPRNDVGKRNDVLCRGPDPLPRDMGNARTALPGHNSNTEILVLYLGCKRLKLSNGYS